MGHRQQEDDRIEGDHMHGAPDAVGRENVALELVGIVTRYCLPVVHRLQDYPARDDIIGVQNGQIGDQNADHAARILDERHFEVLVVESGKLSSVVARREC